MRKLFVMLVAFAAFGFSSSAQGFNPKFGKVSEEEVSMATCPIEPEAGALYIFDHGNISYSSRFEVSYDVYVRIRIFKKDAVELADVEVPFVNATDLSESVRGVEANTYNMVDGKLVKTEMSKKNIFREKVSADLSVVKFSLPEVREGSVIEYKYTFSTTSLSRIPDLDIQRDYPVLHSHKEVSLPEFIGFNVRTQGSFPIKVIKKDAPGFFSVGGARFLVKQVIADHDNVPSLKDEPLVWCLEDYRAKLQTEVSGIELHVADLHVSQRYSHSWDDVNKALRESKLGDYQAARNPLKDEVKAIVSEDVTDVEKIRAILNLVRDKVKRDGSLGLIPDSPASVLKKGTGDRADINNLLSVALKDAGFETDIMLLNPRSLGRLSYFPTIQQIGTFVVRVKDSEGKFHFLDAGDTESDLDVLSPEFLVKNARIFGQGSDAWVDMSSPVQNNTQMNIVVKLEDSGVLKGEYTEVMTNQDAYSFNRAFHKAESEEKYIEENIEKEHKIEVEDAEFKGVGTMNVTSKVSFSMETQKAGEHIYINPTVIQFLSVNPFDQQVRQLPVEFDQTGNSTMQVMVMVPEGYSFEDAPQNIKATACGGEITFRYLTQVTDNSLSARLTLNVGKVMFTTEEYEDLRRLFAKIAEICNAKVVIKKN